MQNDYINLCVMHEPIGQKATLCKAICMEHFVQCRYLAVFHSVCYGSVWHLPLNIEVKDETIFIS